MSLTKEIQSIGARSVLRLPVNVGIVLESNIRKYSQMTSSKELPIVRIAQIDQKHYALNHIDVVLACQQQQQQLQQPQQQLQQQQKQQQHSGKEIRCTIESFANISDAMTEHFRDVHSSDVINTPAVYGMVDLLHEKTRRSKVEIIKLLGIDKNQYVKLLTATSNNHMSESAISQLEKLVAQLSKRSAITPIQASVPLYVLEKISRLSDEKQQIKLIEFLQLDMEKKSDSKLFWMTPEQIDIMMKMIRQESTHSENNREKSSVAEPIDINHIGKKKNTDERQKEDEKNEKEGEEEKTTTSATTKESDDTQKSKRRDDDSSTKSKEPKQGLSEKSKQILDTIPNMLLIEGKTGEPEKLVDIKNKTVSEIDKTSNNKIIKTNPVSSKSLYSIPMDVTKFLRIEDENIHHKNISGVEKLEEFAKSQKDAQQRFTVFWNAV